MSESEKGRARVPTGIAGLDEMLGGGFPAGHVVLVTGLPGTGKTCFGLQFLMAGTNAGEKGVFLSLEEDVPPLLESARQFRWPVDEAVQAGSLKVLRIDPKETRQSLHRIQGELGKELTNLGARRIVVDSVDGVLHFSWVASPSQSHRQRAMVIEKFMPILARLPPEYHGRFMIRVNVASGLVTTQYERV